MRVSTAFFTGVGTVGLAVAAGLGGGLMMGNIMSPQEPKQAVKLERRASPEAPASTKDPLVPVPYLAETQASGNAAVVVAPAEQKPARPQNEASNTAPQGTAPQSNPPQANPPQAAPPSEATASNEPAAKAADAPKPDVPKAAEASTAKPSTSAAQSATVHDPEDAHAKARDSDLKRDADAKRADRRKFERRPQQWADDRRRGPQGREQELRGVEESVREDRGVRVYRDEGEQPVRFEFPHFRLFGPDD
jgi:hypothetical protein